MTDLAATDPDGDAGRNPDDSPTPRRVTSADVARASGVSRTTVSYVLNDVPDQGISRKTWELVVRTARELGHVPFAPARSLRLGRSHIVLALVRDFGLGHIADRILRELDRSLSADGYVLLVHQVDANRPLPELWRTVAPALIVVMDGLSLPDEIGLDALHIDALRVYGTIPHADAGRLQVRHLADRGHRYLAYALPTAASVQLVAGERLLGATETARELGLPPLAITRIDENDPTSVFHALDRWGALPERPTAVCAHNDEVALLICAALEERGLRAGRELAVIGVDDIPAASVRLTTVAIDVEAWGARIADRVRALLRRERPTGDAAGLMRVVARSTT